MLWCWLWIWLGQSMNQRLSTSSHVLTGLWVFSPNAGILRMRECPRGHSQCTGDSRWHWESPTSSGVRLALGSPHEFLVVLARFWNSQCLWRIRMPDGSQLHNDIRPMWVEWGLESSSPARSILPHTTPHWEYTCCLFFVFVVWCV